MRLIAGIAAGIVVTGTLIVFSPLALTVLLSGGLIGSGAILQIQQWM